MPTADEQQLLEQARAKVAALLEVLTRDQADLRHGQSDLPPETILSGVYIYTSAIDAARGTLDNLDRTLHGRATTPASASTGSNCL